MNDMFLHNQWSWFHALGGGALTWLFLKLYIKVINQKLVYDYKKFAFFSMMLIAILWEVVEYFTSSFAASPKFFADSIGDLFCAMVAGVFVVLAASAGEDARKKGF